MTERPWLTRWTGAAAGFGLGAFDTIFVRVIGVKLALGESDATLGIGAFLTLTYVVLGYLFG